MARNTRRAWRAPSTDDQSLAEQDRQAIRNYRGNRGSTRYYRDLKAIDDKTPSTQPDDTKK